MTDIILEVARLVVLVFIVVFLKRAAAEQINFVDDGWRFIELGFILLLFGSALDVTDNFESLSVFVIIGDTETEALLEKVVGFLGGFIFLALGLYRWIPSVNNLKRETDEHKLTALALNEALTSQQAILAAIPDLMFELDEDGKYLNLWARNPDELAASKDAVLGRTVSDLLPADAAGQVMAALREAGEKGQSQGQRIQFPTPDGELWFELSTTLKDRNASPKLFIVLSRNITERMQAEAGLQERENLYRSLIETTDTGYLVLDGDGRVIDANQKYVHLTGHQTLDEILNRSVIEWTAEHDLKRNAQEVQKCIEQGFVHDLQIDYVDKDGVFTPVEINARVVKSQNGIQILSLCRDITERKNAELEKSRLKNQLQQAQKMESLGHVTGGIAHDFNNLLGIINGYADLALSKYLVHGEDGLIKCVSNIRDAGERASSMVKQMLAFSRSDQVDDLPLNLSTLVKEDIKMLHASLPSSIEIKSELEPSLPCVLMNPTQLNQILMNLSINARDAMDGVGGLTIRLGWARALDTESPVSHKPVKGDWIELCVSDTGSGIEEGVVKYMFDPFFTTKEVGKGTGMGLSVIYRIMHDHNGHILLETEPGKGTTFRMLFPPILEEIANSSDIEQESIDIAKGDGSEILVVDDEELLALYITEIVKDQGYEVRYVTDSREALDLFKNEPERFSMVITDQTMPQMTGRELIERLREIRPELPAIICSGHSNKIDASEAGKLNIDYFEKPVDVNNLLSKIADRLGGGGWLHS